MEEEMTIEEKKEAVTDALSAAAQGLHEIFQMVDNENGASCICMFDDGSEWELSFRKLENK